MKKQYMAPKSENVQLDPLMVSFGIDAASPTQFTTPIGDPVVNPNQGNPTIIN